MCCGYKTVIDDLNVYFYVQRVSVVHYSLH